MNKHSKKDRLLFLKYLSISASCFIGTIITKLSLFAHYGSPFRENKRQNDWFSCNVSSPKWASCGLLTWNILLFKKLPSYILNLFFIYWIERSRMQPGGLTLMLCVIVSLFLNWLGGLWDTEPLTVYFYQQSVQLSSHTWIIKDNKWRPLLGVSSKRGNRLDHCRILPQVVCGRIILHSLLAMFNTVTSYFNYISKCYVSERICLTYFGKFCVIFSWEEYWIYVII